jgi:hypothetical protein
MDSGYTEMIIAISDQCLPVPGRAWTYVIFEKHITQGAISMASGDVPKTVSIQMGASIPYNEVTY